MNRSTWVHGLIVGGLLVGAWQGLPEAQAAPVFVDTPCDIPIVDDTVRERLRCGTVTVPRDPADSTAGTFALAVVVKRSANPQSGAAPLLILHGGPGGEQTRFMGSGAADFVPGRDSIAFDMRGGGRTGPALCETMPTALLLAFQQQLRGEDALPAREAAQAQCLDELAQAGFAAAHFGTARNVEDAEAVRQALGVARWAVYGMSYGTTVAAEYLAQHPDVIESVVLDSLYPPDDFVPTVREAQGRAVGRLLEECATDAACAARFPGLDRDAVDAALSTLDGDPLAFRIAGQRYVADELAVRTALHGLFYDEAMARTVPWFVDAVVRRDGEAIAAALGMPLLAGEALVASRTGMPGLLGTDCRDRPRHHAAAPTAGPSWMAMFTGIPSGACAGLPLGTPPGLPLGTTVPVLVLSAGYDGFQPDGAAVAAAIGPAATALTIPLAAHVVRGAGECPRGIVSRFIADPTAAVDSGCLDRMTAPAFLLDARPMPAVIALGAAMQAGTPPPAALAVIGGSLLLLMAGVVVPLGSALWRRWQRDTASSGGGNAAGLRALAVGGGLLGLAGAVVPIAGTFQSHPGAAAFGLDPGLALGLWGIPLGGALALTAMLLAAGQRRWGIAVAAVGGIAACGGLLALGLAPWS